MGQPRSAGRDPPPNSVTEARRTPCPARRDDLPHSASGRFVFRASAPSPFCGNMPCAIPASSMADIELTLPARAENVAVVRHAIGGLGGAPDLDPQTRSGVKLT